MPAPRRIRIADWSLKAGRRHYWKGHERPHGEHLAARPFRSAIHETVISKEQQLTGNVDRCACTRTETRRPLAGLCPARAATAVMVSAGAFSVAHTRPTDAGESRSGRSGSLLLVQGLSGRRRRPGLFVASATVLCSRRPPGGAASSAFATAANGRRFSSRPTPYPLSEQEK
jgi:hypothetical protein